MKKNKAEILQSFDSPPLRNNTACIKWEKNLEKFGRKDLIPLWIADMDFAAPDAVIKALEERAQHGIFGYSYRKTEYIEAIKNWLQARFEWKVEKKDLLFYPSGTVSALNMLVNVLTDVGDQVIVQTPSYPPLMKVVKNNNRSLILNPLKLTDDGYKMDLDALKASITSKTKLLLLCSPHNPSGRVWKKVELLGLAEICKKHDIVVVSDEVHADLVFADVKHCHFNRLPEEKRPVAVTIISSCKTFNLAGLPQATLICESTALKQKIREQINNAQINLDGIFSAEATQAAYAEGADWLDTLLQYLRENRNYLIEFLAKNIPKIKVVEAQGTYLAWLDCRALGMSNQSLQKLLVKKAGVGLYNGIEFGEDGEGFFRVNLACPKALLEEALEKIAEVLAEI